MNLVPLSILDETLAVCHLPPGSPIPAWSLTGKFFSVTRTREELSIVCMQDRAPAELAAERDWRALQVAGPLDFGLTGILAGVAGVLAGAGISIFALSTYDTDFILVKSARLEEAVRALQDAGYPFPAH